MASVTIKRGTEAEVASTAITDGQILFTTDREYNNQIMADVGEDRILIGGNNVFTGTQAEYEEALSQGLIFEGMQVNITDDYNRDLDADVIVYDNTTSGLESTTVQGAIDEIDSNVSALETQVGNSYKTTDTSDTTIASADKIPFYDESATSKKNITLDNFVDTIAPNFASQVSISQGNTLDLLDKDGSPLDSVTIQTTANNVSYTDTNSIGATNVQSALDTLGNYSQGNATTNSTYVSAGTVSYAKVGKICIVSVDGIKFSSLPPSSSDVVFASGLPRAKQLERTMVPFLFPTNPSHFPIRLGLLSQSTVLRFWWTITTPPSGGEYSAIFVYPCE